MRCFLCLFSICAILFSACILDSDKKSDGGSTIIKSKKTLAINPLNPKLPEYFKTDFFVVITPPVEKGERLLWEIHYANIEETQKFISLDKYYNNISGFGFPAGESSIKVSLVDSLEYAALGMNAPHYGSASTVVSARKITIQTQIVTGQDPYRIFCTVTSPEQEYFPKYHYFDWSFGDSDSVFTTDKPAQDHWYAFRMNIH